MTSHIPCIHNRKQMIRILKYTVKYINDEHGFKQKLWRRLYWEVGAWCLTSESTFVQDVKTGLTSCYYIWQWAMRWAFSKHSCCIKSSSPLVGLHSYNFCFAGRETEAQRCHGSCLKSHSWDRSWNPWLCSWELMCTPPQALMSSLTNR